MVEFDPERHVEQYGLVVDEIGMTYEGVMATLTAKGGALDPDDLHALREFEIRNTNRDKSLEPILWLPNMTAQAISRFMLAGCEIRANRYRRTQPMLFWHFRKIYNAAQQQLAEAGLIDEASPSK